MKARSASRSCPMREICGLRRRNRNAMYTFRIRLQGHYDILDVRHGILPPTTASRRYRRCLPSDCHSNSQTQGSRMAHIKSTRPKRAALDRNADRCLIRLMNSALSGEITPDLLALKVLKRLQLLARPDHLLRNTYSPTRRCRAWLALSASARRIIGQYLVNLVDDAGYLAPDLGEAAERLGASQADVRRCSKSCRSSISLTSSRGISVSVW
ncbi:hypothetical protein SAMN05216338_106018 [Bradyrhizobium sp. Rc2d]|nr:hypothetical protein SAMN05216338_106018 [Bradyrhizobium sp. Rc2d]